MRGRVREGALSAERTPETPPAETRKLPVVRADEQPVMVYAPIDLDRQLAVIEKGHRAAGTACLVAAIALAATIVPHFL